MTVIPPRLLFSSRWVALLWAAGICLTAASVARDHDGHTIDAVTSADGNAAQASALLAEDDG